MKKVTALLAAAILATPSALFAQSSQSAPPAEAVDASKLGVDLSRIKRELSEPESEESGDSPLRLRFNVQVIGIAPKVDVMRGFPLDGPIPYGGPTHQEFLSVVTPKEYRGGVFPIYSLAVLAAQKIGQYSKKKQCEAEIEEYRALVMQGVAVTAPRCSQR
jgi:hypothetical protein